MTNSSIFTRVFALALCLLMFAGVLTACFQNTESNPEVSTQSPTNSTVGTTTGDLVENDPTEDPTPIDPNQIFSGSTTLANDALIYGTLANDVFIGGEDGIAAMIPADVKVEAGASSLALSIKKVEDANLADALSNLDVHISGVAADNLVPMTVKLGAILPIGLSQTELKLYHIENDTPVLMTRVASANDFAIHNQYVYDKETGDVTIYVASFSTFSMLKTSADVWDGESDTSWYIGHENDSEYTLESAEQFAGFRDLVDGTAVINGEKVQDSFAGKTVKLGVDIDLELKNDNGELVSFDPIGYNYVHLGGQAFMGTFDGQGHTIYNLYQNGWELGYSYSTEGGGLFASVVNATIKNLTIDSANIVMECIDMGILVGYAYGTCEFNNIIVTNSKIANYNRYTGGIVGEVGGNPDNPKDSEFVGKHTFTNILVDSSVKLSALWGTFDPSIGGVIGGKWGNVLVTMTNVTVAAELDVFSDVTSAYQWYAYRRCGMLIGYTEQESPKKADKAAADFLTCVNVNVYYGDWTNYTYYQFTNQSGKNSEGKDVSWQNAYPWVRAEAGEHTGAFSNARYGNPIIQPEGSETTIAINKSELAETHKTGKVTITFDQLYGGGQGVYGCAEHTGVITNSKTFKTIYIHNNSGWTNLKLQYWFANGNDTWTTIIDGIDMSTMLVEGNVYKLQLPENAHAFKIVADGENETREFYLSEVEENGTYTLDFEHVHNFRANRCDCGAAKQELEHQFTLGEDGEAKHSDGGNMPENYEENGFTLTLEELSNVYGNARDAKGNSCIKLGTSSAVGKFSFTVPENIDKVIIYVAGREAKDAKVSVNGVEYEITTHSDDGEYTAIIVDTSENKTVSFTTVSLNGEERCMINTISYVTTRVVEIHDCDENAELPAVAPSCTKTGLTAGKACSVCGKVMVAQETVSATGHTEEAIPAVDATCTKNGLTEGTQCSVCEEILVAQETVVSEGHNYVEGTCANCGEAFPTTNGPTTYTFSDYTAGTQYAKGEIHELDANVTITTYDCHFTDELRIYSSSTNNGYAIIYSKNPISKIGINAGNKVDTLNIYVSNDGVNWSETPITISVTSTSYKDYEASLNGEYKYLKLDVAGSNQIRIKSMTLTTVPDCAHTSTIEKVVAPTCTEAGRTDTVCSSCSKVISTVAGDPATGHLHTTTTTVNATCTVAGSTTVTCDDCDAVISTETIPTIPHTDVTTDTDHNCDVCSTENVTDHNYVDGTCDCGATEPTEPVHECEHKCAECGKCTDKDCTEDACTNKCEGHNTTTEPTWTLVTDISQLQVGDKIIIVAKDYNFALSTTQNSNNRGQASVTKNGSTVTFGDDVQQLTLKAGTVDGTFAFYTGSGYLYAASSSGNQLKTKSALDDNGSWKIEIGNNGIATIKAPYSSNRNWLRYNSTNNPPIFSCYSSGQADIVIYKLSAGSSSEGGETPTPEHTCEHVCDECQKCTDTNCQETACADKCTGHSSPTEPSVVLEITKDDFTTKSYADNNKTHTKNGYSYTSNQVYQNSGMQWQKSAGYITITYNDFVKLELKSTAGTFTVTVGGKTVTGTTANGVTTYDLTGLTGEIKISVGSVLGKVDYLKFYK